LVDGVKPLLHYSGSSVITVVNGGSLVEPLVTATDNKDGDITASIVKTIKLNGNVVTDVDTLVSGTYEFTYTVTDAAGNSSTTLPINVVVEEAVVEAATLVSVDYTDVPVSVEYGTPLFIMGDMGILKYDINITTSKGARQLSAVWDEGEKAGKVYDANVPGTYVITATLVGDHLNNPSNINLEVTQTIIVKAQVAPITYTITGLSEVNVSILLPTIVSPNYSVDVPEGSEVTWRLFDTDLNIPYVNPLEIVIDAMTGQLRVMPNVTRGSIRVDAIVDGQVVASKTVSLI
jgi:hypothetical protein